MAFELDHCFICVTEGAPEADLLIDFGLSEGESNIHAGQGTANRRFFFHNAMLELLWVGNAAEARNTVTRPTRLWERWNGRNGQSCPFGICLRSVGQDAQAMPFEGWHYKPAYLPENLFILIGNNSARLDEPLLFFIPLCGRPDAAEKRQPLQHASGFVEVSALRIHSPGLAAKSATLESLRDIAGLTFTSADRYLMEIGFDGEKQGRAQDFTPHLPLVFKW